MSSRLTHKKFKNKVYLLYENDYDVIDKYINTSTKIRIKHNLCGNIYSITPKYFLKGECQCPKCKKKIFPYKGYFTKGELIQNLKQKKKELNRIPIAKDMKNPSKRVYEHCFGSWNNALKSAGMILNKYGKYTDEQIIQQYNDLCIKLNKIASIQDIDIASKNNEICNYKTILDRFKSLDNLRDLISLK